MEQNKYEDVNVESPGVLDKYQTAGKILNKVLNELIGLVKADKDIYELCKYGDDKIEEEVKSFYSKKKNLEKGIAFPTCISVNEIVGHFSPLKDESLKLKNGDLVKIDLGVHFDGFPVVAAHTIVIGENKDSDNLVMAAWNALNASLRKMRPGNKNTEITELINKVSEEYKVNPLEGVLSHEIKKFMLDGTKSIINKETYDQKVEEFEFTKNQIFTLDIVMTNGCGKTKESELRTTVFKRCIDVNYDLKSKNSRSFFSEVSTKYSSLGFSINRSDNEIKAKIGVSECLKYNLIQPFQVLLEKEKKLITQFKYTVLIGAKRNIILSGLQELNGNYNPTETIKNKEINDLLSIPLNPVKAKK